MIWRKITAFVFARKIYIVCLFSCKKYVGRIFYTPSPSNFVIPTSLRINSIHGRIHLTCSVCWQQTQIYDLTRSPDGALVTAVLRRRGQWALWPLSKWTQRRFLLCQRSRFPLISICSKARRSWAGLIVNWPSRYCFRPKVLMISRRDDNVLRLLSCLALINQSRRRGRNRQQSSEYQ